MSEGIKNKHSHGNKKRQKTKQKHLPRTNTEKHGKDKSRDTKIRASRSICHGRTRNQKSHTSFRAGCVSDGKNMRFGKGPFDRLRDRGSFATVSELVELAVKLRDRGSFGTVGELAELADINCARAKNTPWVINAMNGTPHTQS